ncbi:sigma-70 family RNA polymerase sigma factor [soil metagenome]
MIATTWLALPGPVPLRWLYMQPPDAAAPAGRGGREVGSILADLIRTGGGDRAAFARLYDRMAPVVFGVVKRVVVDPAISEEVAQEVMLEVWRRAPRFDAGRGSPAGWIATIAHRRAVDRVRSEQAMRKRVERVASAAGERSTEDVEAEVIRGVERTAANRALETLNAEQRRALELAYFGGLTQTEIAGELGIPLGTVKSRMRQGMVALRRVLEAAR